jgi:hypothetical protein
MRSSPKPLTAALACHTIDSSRPLKALSKRKHGVEGQGPQPHARSHKVLGCLAGSSILAAHKPLGNGAVGTSDANNCVRAAILTRYPARPIIKLRRRMKVVLIAHTGITSLDHHPTRR